MNMFGKKKADKKTQKEPKRSSMKLSWLPEGDASVIGQEYLSEIVREEYIHIFLGLMIDNDTKDSLKELIPLHTVFYSIPFVILKTPTDFSSDIEDMTSDEHENAGLLWYNSELSSYDCKIETNSLSRKDNGDIMCQITMNDDEMSDLNSILSDLNATSWSPDMQFRVGKSPIPPLPSSILEYNCKIRIMFGKNPAKLFSVTQYSHSSNPMFDDN
jgi:hypothetical protein